MRKILFILSLVFILFSVSCKQNKEEDFYEYNFVAIDSFSLPLIDSVHNLPYDIQLLETDTANLLFTYYRNDEIVVYNVDKQVIVKRIFLKKRVPIFSFNVISLDSIFVFYNTGDLKRYNDSVFQLINYDGDLLKNYGIFEEHFKSLKNDTDIVDFQYFSHSVFYKMVYQNSELFFSVQKLSAKKLGDSASLIKDLPPIASLNTQTGKVSFVDFPVYFPPSGYFYSNSFLYNKIFLSASNNVLFATSQTADIYEYNVLNKQLEKHRLASIILDTVIPEKNGVETDLFYFNDYKGSFGDVLYDKYRNFYYRLCFLPKKVYKNREIFVVADNKLNKLGEGIFPEDYVAFKMIFSKDYILMFNVIKTFSTEGKIFFSKFKIEKFKTTEKEFLSKLEKLPADTVKCNIKSGENTDKSFQVFLDNYIHEKSYAVLFVPFLKSCPSCKDYAVFYYSLNKEYFKKNNVYLFFDYGNISAVKSYLTKKNLRLSSKNILIDSLNKYDEFVNGGFYNPRVAIICNKKLIYDKTYHPSELGEIDSVLFNFTRELKCN